MDSQKLDGIVETLHVAVARCGDRGFAHSYLKPIIRNLQAMQQADGIHLNLIGGRSIDLRNPQAEDIHIEDIACALSKICRFAGHVPRFYSVAQHCVLVSQACTRYEKLQGLLHDASEAYLNDLTRALKHSPDLAGYRALEDRMESVIYDTFKVDHDEVTDANVKSIDRCLADIEVTTMLRGIDLTPGLATAGRIRESAGGVYEGSSPIPYRIIPLSPDDSEKLFLDHFHTLTKER